MCERAFSCWMRDCTECSLIVLPPNKVLYIVWLSCLLFHNLFDCLTSPSALVAVILSCSQISNTYKIIVQIVLTELVRAVYWVRPLRWLIFSPSSGPTFVIMYFRSCVLTKVDNCICGFFSSGFERLMQSSVALWNTSNHQQHIQTRDLYCLL